MLIAGVKQLSKSKREFLQSRTFLPVVRVNAKTRVYPYVLGEGDWPEKIVHNFT